MSGFSHFCAGESWEFSGKLPFSGLNIFFSCWTCAINPSRIFWFKLKVFLLFWCLMLLSQWIFYYAMEFIDTLSDTIGNRHSKCKRMEVENGMGSFLYRSVTMPERVIRYLPWKTQTPTIAGGARKQQLWRWFGWKSRFWRCDIGDLYLKNYRSFWRCVFLAIIFGNILILPWGVTIWRYILGSLFMPLGNFSQPHGAISGNTFIMGHFAKVQTKCCQAVFVWRTEFLPRCSCFTLSKKDPFHFENTQSSVF